jgi:hypothetical protein
MGDLEPLRLLLDADQLGKLNRDRDVTRVGIEQFRFKREGFALAFLE